MTNLRTAFSALVVALLGLGSAGSAWAALHGSAPDWARKADAEPIRMLALLILVIAVLLAFVPERKESER